MPPRNFSVWPSWLDKLHSSRPPKPTGVFTARTKHSRFIELEEKYVLHFLVPLRDDIIMSGAIFLRIHLTYPILLRWANLVFPTSLDSFHHLVLKFLHILLSNFIVNYLIKAMTFSFHSRHHRIRMSIFVQFLDEILARKSAFPAEIKTVFGKVLRSIKVGEAFGLNLSSEFRR